jgi:hypothetical protein
VDFGDNAWVGKGQDDKYNSVKDVQYDIDGLESGMQIAKGGKVVQDHSTVKKDMGAGIFPGFRNVHTIFSDTGGTLDLADLVLIDELRFGFLLLWFILFWFHRIGLGIVKGLNLYA